MLSLRDPVHGFVRADRLEAALVNSRPVQRLRFIHQLGLTYLVFPGAEHSRFSHVLGAMHLAGRVYDALAAKGGGLLDPAPDSAGRRLVRAAALLHDVGHAPFSHSAEDLFEQHRPRADDPPALFPAGGRGDLRRRGRRPGHRRRGAAAVGEAEGPAERLLAQIVSGELDVDKMDYLLRDSLYCGVRYGIYDLDRLLDTLAPIQDPETGAWGIGVEEGGVHAVEALVLARYYMFTQVYFNVTGKALELHLNEWLRESGRRWPADPKAFLVQDDVSVLTDIRDTAGPHAAAIARRAPYPLAFETREHLDAAEKAEFEAFLPELRERFGATRILVSNSAKDPHRLGRSRVLVRRHDGSYEPMAEASNFIRHMTRIERYRIYTPPELRADAAAALRKRFPAG